MFFLKVILLPKDWPGILTWVAGHFCVVANVDHVIVILPISCLLFTKRWQADTVDHHVRELATCSQRKNIIFVLT